MLLGQLMRTDVTWTITQDVTWTLKAGGCYLVKFGGMTNSVGVWHCYTFQAGRENFENKLKRTGTTKTTIQQIRQYHASKQGVTKAGIGYLGLLY
jgi:hypothetical protein